MTNYKCKTFILSVTSGYNNKEVQCAEKKIKRNKYALQILNRNSFQKSNRNAIEDRYCFKGAHSSERILYRLYSTSLHLNIPK